MKKVFLFMFVTILAISCNKKEEEKAKVKQVDVIENVKKAGEVKKVDTVEKKADTKTSKIELVVKKVKDGVVELYTKDESGEKLLKSIDSVYTEHFHYSEVKNEKLFIIKRVGDTVNWSDWSDELWVFDNVANKDGKKLYSLQGLSFSASENGEKVAVVSGKSIFMVNIAGETLKELSISKVFGIAEEDAESYNTYPEGWSADSKTFWIAGNPEGVYEKLVKIDSTDWSIKSIDVPKGKAEYQFNVLKELLVYSDIPNFFDEDSLKDFQKSKKAVKLYIFNLSTNKTEEIATSVAKHFNPTWKDSSTLEYDNPEGTDRKTYSIK